MGSDWGEEWGWTGGNGVGLWENGVRPGGVGLGYKRRGQLIWLHSLPLIEPRPPASN